MNLIWATTELRVRKELEPATLKDLRDILHSEGMFDATQEVFWVCSYDPMTNLRALVEIARGNYYRVSVSIPALLNAVLVSGADRFYIGHNHPSGEVKPTEKDIRLTKQINVAAALTGLFIEDHWVIGPKDKVWSMRERGQLTPSPAITELYAANGPIRTHERKR